MCDCAGCKRRREDRGRGCVPAAPGPFPRTAWIHPHIPEDELDRVCFNIWKRSVWARRSAWPHAAGNAHTFTQDFSHCRIQKQQHTDAPPVMVIDPHESAEICLTVQQEMIQTLQSELDSVTTGEHCSRGDDPGNDNPVEVLSIQEAQRSRTEKILKDAIITKLDIVKEEVSEGPSLEDFPPLPRAASPWGYQPAEKAGKTEKAQSTNEVSPDMPPLGFKSQTFDEWTPSKSQRTRMRKMRQRLQPVVFTKAAEVEEIQVPQASKAHNEPCSQLSRLCQSGDLTKTLDGGQTSEKQGRSNVPEFAMFLFGDGLQGKSADGTRVARDPAGTDSAGTRKAAGPPQNARNHRFQEDATVLERKTLSSSNDKGLSIGHMARIQAQARQYDTTEHHGLSSASGMPASSWPGSQSPMRHPPGFTQSQ